VDGRAAVGGMTASTCRPSTFGQTTDQRTSHGQKVSGGEKAALGPECLLISATLLPVAPQGSLAVRPAGRPSQASRAMG
jgi:hypothetical protein